MVSMVRKQVFIRQDQQERLKEVAATKGVAVAELIRDGIDLIIEGKTKADDESWKEGFRQVAGMWAHRTDLDELYAERRRRRAERRKRMNALVRKAFS